MPVKSYLAIPARGKKEVLLENLQAFSTCEVTESDNKEVLLLVTETSNEEEDQVLFKNINGLANLQLLTLVSAFSE